MFLPSSEIVFITSEEDKAVVLTISCRHPRTPHPLPFLWRHKNALQAGARMAHTAPGHTAGQQAPGSPAHCLPTPSNPPLPGALLIPAPSGPGKLPGLRWRARKETGTEGPSPHSSLYSLLTPPAGSLEGRGKEKSGVGAGGWGRGSYWAPLLGRTWKPSPEILWTIQRAQIHSLSLESDPHTGEVHLPR